MNNETEQIYLLNPSVNLPSSTQKFIEFELTPSNPVNLENVEDFSNVCRTCATITEFVVPIFEGEGIQNNLTDKIHKHLPIQVSEQDILPKVVCYQCASTLLAWHEMVQCCVQADEALRTRLLVLAEKKEKETNAMKDETGQNTGKAESKWDWRYISDEDNNISDLKSESSDDRPLSTLAIKNSQNIYKNFYKALVNFRNHYVKDHEDDGSTISESSDSEIDIEHHNNQVDDYDDLSYSNMRKDKMNIETRTELNQVQCKINGKVFYTCNICGKNLSSTHTYIFHKRIHTGERPCVCHVCGKLFRTPNGLQRHVTETHEQVRRHTCSLCLKTFANSQNLKQHLRIHTGERPFSCSHCGKRFTQSGALHVHVKTHSHLFPYSCDECGAKFRLRSGLVKHRSKHTGERPHVCHQCGKTFRHRHELNSHTLCHTDAKPFSCGICGVAFRQRRTLRHHTKRVHETECSSREITHPIIYNNGNY